MKQETLARTENKRTLNSKWGVVGALIAVLVVVLIFILFKPPERSIASYCKVHSEEKARLAKFPGDTYPSGVFNNEISDAGAFAESYGKLEKVAPEEIRSDIETLKNLYTKMDEDPSTAIGASLAASGPDGTIKKWTAENCK